MAEAVEPAMLPSLALSGRVEILAHNYQAEGLKVSSGHLDSYW